jgi:hypothetical protein
MLLASSIRFTPAMWDFERKTPVLPGTHLWEQHERLKRLLLLRVQP